MASYEDKLITVESSNDPNAHNKTSDALGLGQHVPGTFIELTQKYRPDLLKGVDLNNPQQRAAFLELRRDANISREMVTAYARENVAMWEKSGITGTSDGQKYLGHFLGGGGALKAFTADPNEPIPSFLKRVYTGTAKDGTPMWQKVYQGNINVFTKGLNGAPVSTVSDLMGWAELKMGGDPSNINAPSGNVAIPGGPLSNAATFSPFPTPDADLQRRVGEEQAALRANNEKYSTENAAFKAGITSLPGGALFGSVFEFGELRDAWRSSSEIDFLWQSSPRDKPDLSYRLDEEKLKGLTEGLPEHLHSLFERAHSEGHAQRLRQYALDVSEAEQRLGTAGWSGIAAKSAVILTDPLMWGATAMTGGLLSPASVGMRLSGVGRAIFGGVQGAASGVATEMVLGGINPTKGSTEDLILAGLAGITLGVALSPALANAAPTLKPELKKLHTIASQGETSVKFQAVAAKFGVAPEVYTRAVAAIRGLAANGDEAAGEAARISAKGAKPKPFLKVDEITGNIAKLDEDIATASQKVTLRDIIDGLDPASGARIAAIEEALVKPGVTAEARKALEQERTMITETLTKSESAKSVAKRIGDERKAQIDKLTADKKKLETQLTYEQGRVDKLTARARKEADEGVSPIPKVTKSSPKAEEITSQITKLDEQIATGAKGLEELKAGVDEAATPSTIQTLEKAVIDGVEGGARIVELLRELQKRPPKANGSKLLNSLRPSAASKARGAMRSELQKLITGLIKSDADDAYSIVSNLRTALDELDRPAALDAAPAPSRNLPDPEAMKAREAAQEALKVEKAKLETELASIRGADIAGITADDLAAAIKATPEEAAAIIKWMTEEGRILPSTTAPGEFDVLPITEAHAQSLSAAATTVSAGRQLSTWGGAEGLADDLIDAPFTAFGRFRFDAAGKAKSSSNPLVRVLGGIAFDAVGNKVKSIVQAIAPSEWMSRRVSVFETEYMTTRVPAFSEWRKSKGYNAFQSLAHHGQFNEEVSLYIAGALPNAHPGVKRVGDKLSELYERIREAAQNPGAGDGRTLAPLKGAQNLPPDRSWFPREWDMTKINRVVDEHGLDAAENVLAKALSDVRPNADPKVSLRAAKAMLVAITKHKTGMNGDALSGVNGLNEEALFDMLQGLRDVNGNPMVDDQTLRFLTSQLEDKTTSSSHLKPRTDLNTRAEITVATRSGGQATVRLTDLLNTDADALFRGYNRHMHGRIALARWQVPNPAKPGEFIIDGIRSQGEWDTQMNHVRSVATELGIPQTQTTNDIANLSFMHDYLTGAVPQMNRGQAAEYVRMAMKFNFVRVMNQVGLAQIPEMGRVMSTAGWKAALVHMPAMRRVMNSSGQDLLNDGFAQELEAAAGIGTERIRGTVSRWEEWADPNSVLSDSPLLRKVDQGLDVGKRITADISLMSAIDTFSKRWAVKAIAQKIADMAHGTTAINWNRMRDMGMSEAQWKTVFDQIKLHSTSESGWTTAHKITRLNLDKWDIAARANFENSLARWAKRTVQENDVGMMGRWMSSTWVQMFTQFRTFMLGAWTNQFLHQVHMRDFETFSTFALTSVMGGMVYAVQAKLRGVGRSDQREYEEKYLTAEKIGAASFARASWSSLFPMLIDTAMLPTGLDPLFDMRSTMQPSNAIMGNPVAGLFDAAVMGPRGFAREGGMTQGDARRLQSLLPLSNFLPFMWAFNSSISDLPEKSR